MAIMWLVAVNTIITPIIAGTIPVYAIFSGKHPRMRMKLLKDA